MNPDSANMFYYTHGSAGHKGIMKNKTLTVKSYVPIVLDYQGYPEVVSDDLALSGLTLSE